MWGGAWRSEGLEGGERGEGHRSLPPKAAAGGKLSLRSQGHEGVAPRGATHAFCGGMAEPQPLPPHHANKAAVSEHHHMWSPGPPRATAHAALSPAEHTLANPACPEADRSLCRRGPASGREMPQPSGWSDRDSVNSGGWGESSMGLGGLHTGAALGRRGEMQPRPSVDRGPRDFSEGWQSASPFFSLSGSFCESRGAEKHHRARAPSVKPREKAGMSGGWGYRTPQKALFLRKPVPVMGLWVLAKRCPWPQVTPVPASLTADAGAQVLPLLWALVN